MTDQYRIDHYILDKTLGSGGFGKVKLAVHEYTGSRVAIKIINKKLLKSEKMSIKIKREIRLMKYFNHPNMIQLYQVLDSPQNIFVVMEYVPGGELFNLVNECRGFDEPTSRKYFRQIIDGVEYIHQNLICHRDLKLENILVDNNGLVKIVDFGLSNFMKDGQFLTTSCGSLQYAAPEVVNGQVYSGNEVDIWSCGVILFAMLTGALPFDDDDKMAVVQKISQGDYIKPPKQLSHEALDLISKMLRVNPLERISIPEIKRHPWYLSSEQSALVLKDYTNKDESHKVNDYVLEKLLEIEDFDYKGLEVEGVKDAIRKKRNYSFVVGYELLLRDYKKETEPVESHANQLYFGPVKDYLDLYQQEINKYYESVFSENFPKEWVYGVRLHLTAEESLKRVIQVFQQLTVSYVVKSTSYLLKCTFNPFQDAAGGMEQENAAMQAEGEDGAEKPEVLQTETSQVQFHMQIYRLDQKLHLIDLKRTAGNPMVFMDLSQKVRRALLQN